MAVGVLAGCREGWRCVMRQRLDFLPQRLADKYAGMIAAEIIPESALEAERTQIERIRAAQAGVSPAS